MMTGTLQEALTANRTDFTIDGECIGCGECCSDILPMTDEEVKTIKRYIKKHNIKEQRYHAMAVQDMTCPFMSKDKGKDKCLIYEVRPTICRVYTCHKFKDRIATAEDMKGFNAMSEQGTRVVFARKEFYEGL